MEIETQTCDGCGAEHDVCSECGGRNVTLKDYIDGDVDHPRKSIRNAVLDADDGDEIEIVQVCWDCGAACRRALEVSVHHE